jgi:hypothetical protein
MAVPHQKKHTMKKYYVTIQMQAIIVTDENLDDVISDLSFGNIDVENEEVISYTIDDVK